MTCREQNNEIFLHAVKTYQLKFWLYKLCLDEAGNSSRTVISEQYFADEQYFFKSHYNDDLRLSLIYNTFTAICLLLWFICDLLGFLISFE